MADDVELDDGHEPISQPIVVNLQAPSPSKDHSGDKLKTYIDYAFRAATLLLIPGFIWMWNTDRIVGQEQIKRQELEAKVLKLETEQEKHDDDIQELKLSVRTMEVSINAAVTSIEKTIERLERDR